MLAYIVCTLQPHVNVCCVQCIAIYGLYTTDLCNFSEPQKIILNVLYVTYSRERLLISELYCNSSIQ